MSSRTLRLGMISALSLTVAAACGGDDDEVTAYCVDAETYQQDGSYQVVDEDYCDDDDGGSGRSHYSSHGGYYWYYGGHRSGSRITKGTTVKPRDTTIVSSKGKTLQRGGFGSRSSSGGS